ncbi:MAG: glycosyltransferase family 2 protein [Paracoccaceae bacterium]
MMRHEKTLLSIARNEGMFMVEWLAHHLAIGFDFILVGTNDCDDATDALLDAAARHFPVERFDNEAPLDTLTIHQRGLKRGLAHQRIAGAEWVLVSDLDEFLHINDANGRLDRLDPLLAGADALCLFWRLFGSGGLVEWPGGKVTEHFVYAESEAGQQVGHKTLFRPDVFRAATPHCPKDPVKPREALRIVNTRGQPLETETVCHPRGTVIRTEPTERTWDRAAIFHYHAKSEDCTLLKNMRADPNGRRLHRRRLNSDHYIKMNRNDVHVTDIARTAPLRNAMIARMLAVPAIREAHEDSVNWFATARETLLTPDRRALWTA